MKKLWAIGILFLVSVAILIVTLKLPISITEEQKPMIEKEEQRFRQPITYDGGYHCNCGGALRQIGEAKLHRTIDRSSPNQQGIRWIYSFRYCCDLCQWDRIYIHVSAMPLE